MCSLGSDADRQSGSGGEEGNRELKINRRKRKNPVKLPLQQQNNTDLDIINSNSNSNHQDIEPMTALSNNEYPQQPPQKRSMTASGVNLELVQQHQQNLKHK